jgi:alcohol dehydrogenase
MWLPQPRPEPRGAEVLVRITCCTLCRSDLLTFTGRRNEPTPTILGYEMVGQIEAFGPQAARHDAEGVPVEPGTRITWAIGVGCGTCFFCKDDLPQKCQRLYKYGHRQIDWNSPWGGGLANYILLVPRTYWLRLPDTVPDEVVAFANFASATVAAVMRLAGPLSRRTVLVLGAGVLGLTACAMASVAGAVAVVVSDPVAACQERATAFGANACCGTNFSDQRTCLDPFTDGRGADVVLELAGTASSAQVGLQLCRTGGRHYCPGWHDRTNWPSPIQPRGDRAAAAHHSRGA